MIDRNSKDVSIYKDGARRSHAIEGKPFLVSDLGSVSIMYEVDYSHVLSPKDKLGFDWDDFYRAICDRFDDDLHRFKDENLAKAAAREILAELGGVEIE